MIQLFRKLKQKRRLARLRKESLEPSRLPVGLTEFNKFCDDIIELAGQFADRDSLVYAIASNIIHIKHDCDAVPKDYFVKCLRKAAANQVASDQFVRIKEIHDKRMAEDMAAKQAEATAKSNAVADATTQKV